MMRKPLLTSVFSLCLLLLSVSAHAQTVRGSIGIFGRLGTWINATTGEGLDTTYVGIPERPWQLIAQSFTYQSDLLMKSSFDGSQMYQGIVGDVSFQPRIRTAVTTSAGFWIGYRGWGLGYSNGIWGNNGDDWDFELSSYNYYVKLRLHDFEGADLETRQSGYLTNSEDPTAPPDYFDFTQPMYLSSPVRIKAQLFEGVYIFNSSRFSYSAAYDQSLTQLRSAGSALAGLRYFHSDYNYAHDTNADIILNMNDIGRISTWQVSVGAGYAYNWVPVKGLLFSIMAMPMVTAYNHINTYRYDSNYRQLALDDQYHSDDELSIEDYRISLMDTDSKGSRIMLNVNSRASVAYNWSRWYLSVNGNFYNARYRYGNSNGRLNDWNVNANIGVRF